MAKSIAFSPAPTPAKEGYATCRVECVVDIAADTFFDWYLFEPIENFMHGTMIVAPITGTQMMDGPAWPETGSVRGISFKDGTTALERITSMNLPRSYCYQPWAFTNPIRLLSNYATATMSALPENGKTRIVWDYGFHPRSPIMRPLLQAIVSLDWKRNLQNGLDVLKAHLDVHGTAKRIHEINKVA